MHFDLFELLVLVLKEIACGTKLLHINSNYINTQQFLIGFNQLARYLKIFSDEELSILIMEFENKNAVELT